MNENWKFIFIILLIFLFIYLWVLFKVQYIKYDSEIENNCFFSYNEEKCFDKIKDIPNNILLNVEYSYWGGLNFFQRILFQWNYSLYSIAKYKGYDFNIIAKDNWIFKATNLHHAVQGWNIEIINDLLSMNNIKTLVNEKDSKGWTPIIIAIEFWQFEIIDSLIRNWAIIDMNFIDYDWKSLQDIVKQSYIDKNIDFEKYNKITDYINKK